MNFLRTRLSALAALTLLASACATAPVQTGAADRAAAVPAGELLYVCNQDDATVSVIDLATNRVVRTVDLQRLGFSANAKPHHVAVEPDGSHWYVTLIGDGRVVKLDSSDRVIAQVPFETPGMLALDPERDLLFVARSMTAVNPPQRIGMIRRSDMSVEEIPVLFPRPHALALEPRTSTVYTASLAVNQLAAIDVDSERVEVHNVDGPPHALMQFAISPDGRTLAVSAELSHRVLLFDVSDRLQPRLISDIPVERQPFDPLFTPDGRWLYLGNKAADAVTVIDVPARQVAAVIRGRGLAQPHGIAVSADGSRVYVSNNNLRQTQHDMSADHDMHAAAAAPAGNGTIVVIDTDTRAIVEVIEVGRNATGIGTRTTPRLP